MKMRLLLLASAISSVLYAAPAVAAVKLPAVFGDHMVLQRDRELPVWGWAEAGEQVTVSIADQKATAQAGDDGKWLVKLKALEAGGPHTLTVAGKTAGESNQIELKDVLVGEVWVCSGQSNMEWAVSQSNNPQEEIKAADHPQIRLFEIPKVPNQEPQDDVNAKWEVCSPQTIADFTAVGYFFGRKLQKELNVPVGLIQPAWGGTRIEPWTPPAGFASVEGLEELAEKKADKFNHQSPRALYNAMVHPIVPYAVRGAIWYQGESNRGNGSAYADLMKALIQGWRTVWNDPEMPFLFVQLAPYNYGKDNEHLLPLIWEAQSKSLEIPNTGMAVTVDIGNTKDIHPRNKQDVGLRLALWSLANTYGQKDLVYSGPLYESMKVEGDKVKLAFDHVGGGLVARDGKQLTHFQVAGEDKVFHDAQATIEGDTVVVHSDKVKKPVAVRYAWHEEAEPNLSNKDGLPASPFRTDNWQQ